MVTVSAVTFLLPDPRHRLAGVRLRSDAPIAGDLLDFSREGDDWELAIGQPPVNRMEYLLEIAHADGTTEVTPDPGNPHQVSGAFGRRSVIEFPSYAPPRWLAAPSPPGAGFAADLAARSLDQPVSVRTWSPADAPEDEPLPLLLVHDGPEYDALASLTRYLSAGINRAWTTAPCRPARSRWPSPAG